VQAKTNCLVRYGLSHYSGLAPYIGGDGLYAFDPGADTFGANLNVAMGDPVAPDIWVVAVRKHERVSRSLRGWC
jgi:hypothetical protein